MLSQYVHLLLTDQSLKHQFMTIDSLLKIIWYIVLVVAQTARGMIRPLLRLVLQRIRSTSATLRKLRVKALT